MVKAPPKFRKTKQNPKSFGFSNRFLQVPKNLNNTEQVPIFKSISKALWIFKPISKGDEKFMIEINAKITFDSYEFRRVKPMGSNCVLYTKQNLIGKEVCIIPVDMHTTDRYIESCKDENGQYHINLKIREVIRKKVTDGSNTGRVYMPTRYLGIDCLIVEAPKLDYFL